jgi:uncharacterized protein YebE (UPF0316 family)
MSDHFILPIAYAAGFASGNAVGIQLERKLALGECAVRMITSHGAAVTEALREFGRVQATFQAEPRESRKTLVLSVRARRRLPQALGRARAIDPELFWIVERFAETSRLEPLPHATGWRSVLKMK